MQMSQILKSPLRHGNYCLHYNMLQYRLFCILIMESKLIFLEICSFSLSPFISCVLNQIDPTSSIVVIWVIFFQTELMVEIYSMSLVKAIG